MKKVYLGLAIILLVISIVLTVVFFTTGSFPKILTIMPILLIIICAAFNKKK